MVAAKVIPAPSVNQRMIDNELSVLRLAHHIEYMQFCLTLSYSGCLQELQSYKFITNDGCHHQFVKCHFCNQSGRWVQS